MTNATMCAATSSPAHRPGLTFHRTARHCLHPTGIRGHIPAAYTHLEKEFLRQLAKVNHEQRVRLSEYSRPGWTFHAKGRQPWPTLPLNAACRLAWPHIFFCFSLVFVPFRARDCPQASGLQTTCRPTPTSRWSAPPTLGGAQPAATSRRRWPLCRPIPTCARKWQR